MTTTTLKIIALIFMFIDHIGEFIPGVPVWFRWIGRLSAPIFFFCMALGFYYTKDRKKYLLRIYIFGVGMEFTKIIVNNLRSSHYYIKVTNNIFVTMFIACILITIIDTFHDNPIMGKKYLVIFTGLQIFSTTLIIIANHFETSNIPIEFYGTIFGNIFVNEGGVPFIILGVIFYYTKHNKKKLIISYSCFCIIYSFLYYTNTVARIVMKLEHVLPDPIYNIIWVIPQIFGIEIMPTYQTRFFVLNSYHWMVIFALPFMLLYNGEKGKGYKYLFYIFYPVHIYILYFIGYLLS